MKENELADYLKQNKGYKRIMEAIIKKYKSLGKLGGSIQLAQLSDEEIKLLSPYDYSVGATKACKLTIRKFAEGLCAGKFEGADFEETLQLYAGGIISNREAVQREQEESQLFFDGISHAMQNEKVKAWMNEALQTKSFGYLAISKLYKENRKELGETLQALDKLGTYLHDHKEWVLLPVLASAVTGDTHYFDLNRKAGKLMLYYLSYEQCVDFPEKVEEINEVLMSAKIVRDELSNSTICYGLYGKNERLEKPWESFWQIGEPLQLTVYNVKDVTKMHAMGGKAYIVENPAAFAALLPEAIKKGVSLICTSGQINTSSYMILDLLEAAGTAMYYNGDFDPEGLQIADRLNQKYEQLQLWCYEAEDYKKVKSQVQLEKRLKKLERIKSPELSELIECMQQEKTAGYQELLTDRLISSML